MSPGHNSVTLLSGGPTQPNALCGLYALPHTHCPVVSHTLPVMPVTHTPLWSRSHLTVTLVPVAVVGGIQLTESLP
jgi:hypothetical protein